MYKSLEYFLGHPQSSRNIMFTLLPAVSLVLALCSISVSATPLGRSTCTPNAQGAAVSIVSSADGTLKWGDANPTPTVGDVLSALSFDGDSPNFHVAQSGQFPTSFVINDVNNHALFVDSSTAGSLTFNTTSVDFDQGFQLFDITCQSCGSDTTPGQSAGSSCTVSPLGPFVNACVRIVKPDVSGLPLIVGSCEGSELQLFDIVF
ncbi:hypothetical protein BDP27DRAFT_1316828 [Rhodocollybia butyracea]|uniref:Uncharacterized protein n=1 Tax=Rhodocollybia butyracea TaxID=206335 RepID=A0A9P5PXI1_9AGAR|nr:hypothetical protein BDP27DRAFT_1316828 [Rhodocollybia butyracea]